MAVNETTDIGKVRKTLEIAFKISPENDYLTKKFWNLPAATQLSRAEINESFKEYIEYFISKGGILLEANNFDCVAIIVPPKFNPLELEDTEDPTFNEQFIEAGNRYKNKLGLGTTVPYYYLFMIGKNLDQLHIKGSARAIIDYLKEKADSENAAVMLEAINKNAKEVYTHFGFENYGEFSYGVGEVDSKGKPNTNGEGFTATFMAYFKGGKLPLQVKEEASL